MLALPGKNPKHGCTLVLTRQDASFRGGGASGAGTSIPGDNILSSGLLNETHSLTIDMVFHSGSRMRTSVIKIPNVTSL